MRAALRRSLCLTVSALCALVSCAPEFETSVQEVHTVCATETTVRGVDVSVYQGMIDWPAAARGGIRFAMIRQSHGTTADNTFMRNWNGARANGILRGAYQYFSPQADAAMQANALCDALIAAGFGPGDLPPMIDVEEPAPMGGSLPPPAQYADRVRTWLNIVRTRLGVNAIIYTGGYYWDANLRTSEFAMHPLWHAEYPNYPGTIYQVGVNPLPRNSCPQAISNAWPRWSFWQFAGNNGRAPGFGGAVDCDVFNGSFDQLRALARVPGFGDAGVVTDSGVTRDSGVVRDSGTSTMDVPASRDVPNAVDDRPMEFDVVTRSQDAAVSDVQRQDSSTTGQNAGGCGCRIDALATQHGDSGSTRMSGYWALAMAAAMLQRARRARA